MDGIGKRLKQERLRLSLTQSALGAIGGVEANAQGHYESGQRMPRADYLFKIAAAGVDITRVVTGVGIPLPTQPSFTPSTGSDETINHDLMASVSMVKIIGQLRQSLWVTADALYEVTKMMGAEEKQSLVDRADKHAAAQQGDVKGLS